MELVHQHFHIGVSVGEAGGREVPVAFGDLVAVIECSPLEAQFLDLRQRAQDLVDREAALVAPGAPGGLEGRRLALGHHDTLRFQQRSIVAKGAEAVAVEHGDEGRAGLDSLAGMQHHRRVILFLDADRGEIFSRLFGDGQAHEHRVGLQMTDHHAGIAPPQADSRNAAAIVGVVHAHIVLLEEAVADRQEPVVAFFRRLPLERPEAGIVARGVHLQVADRPAVHGDVGGRAVDIHGPDHQGRREALVGSDGHDTDQAFGGRAPHHQAAALPEGIADLLTRDADRREGDRSAARPEAGQFRDILQQGRHRTCGSQLQIAVLVGGQGDVPVLQGIAPATCQERQGGQDEREDKASCFHHKTSFCPKYCCAAWQTASFEEKAPVPPAAVVLIAPVRLPSHWHVSRSLPWT